MSYCHHSTACSSCFLYCSTASFTALLGRSSWSETFLLVRGSRPEPPVCCRCCSMALLSYVWPDGDSTARVGEQGESERTLEMVWSSIINISTAKQLLHTCTTQYMDTTVSSNRPMASTVQLYHTVLFSSRDLPANWAVFSRAWWSYIALWEKYSSASVLQTYTTQIQVFSCQGTNLITTDDTHSLGVVLLQYQ